MIQLSERQNDAPSSSPLVEIYFHAMPEVDLPISGLLLHIISHKCRHHDIAPHSFFACHLLTRMIMAVRGSLGQTSVNTASCEGSHTTGLSLWAPSAYAWEVGSDLQGIMVGITLGNMTRCRSFGLHPWL